MRLQAYRSKHKLTQDDVAKRIQKHVTTVSKYESGDIVPSLDAMNRISKLTKGEVTMMDFIAQRNQKNKERAGNGNGSGRTEERKNGHIPPKKTLLH